MKKTSFITGITVSSILLFSAFLLLGANQESDSGTDTNIQSDMEVAGVGGAPKKPTENRTPLAGTNGLMMNSPFAAGQGQDNIPAPPAATISKPLANSAEPEKISAEETARRKKMEQLGYMVPPEYYQKDLMSLRQLAKAGDAWAMVHLGERYYFELQGQPQTPGYEAGMDYAREARHSFTNALAAGNIRSAAIIAETYLQENNAVDAYAWHILSEQLGDNISADWFRRTKLYAGLTEQEKQLARAKIPELAAAVNSQAEKMKLKPIFQNFR